MVYRTIVENFNRGRLNPFLNPIVYDNVNSYIDLDVENNFVTCYCNDAVTDAAAIKTMFPVCGDYILWLRFRVVTATDDSDFLTIFESTNVPKPNTYTTLRDLMKLECIWDTSEPEIETYYFDTSNDRTNLDVNNSATANTWYWLRLLRDTTNYTITIYHNNFAILTGPSSIAFSSVNETSNPDYIVLGTLANDDHQIDVDYSYFMLKFDPYKNNYSNYRYYSNNYIWGKGLG